MITGEALRAAWEANERELEANMELDAPLYEDLDVDLGALTELSVEAVVGATIPAAIFWRGVVVGIQAARIAEVKAQ